MLKIASYFLGEDLALLSSMDHNSKSKVKKLFLYVLIPTFMTGLAIYTLTGLMEFSTPVRWGATIASALLIFLVDTSLASAATLANPKLMRNRYWITGCIAVFGALGVDSLMFHSAIEPIAIRLHHERMHGTIDAENADLDAQIRGLESAVAAADNRVTTRENQYIGEISGTSGTRQRGVGNVAGAMEGLTNIARADRAEASSNLTAAQAQRVANANRLRAEVSTPGPLLHIQAMGMFLYENPLALLLWIPWTLLCIFLDVLFLRYKQTTDETAYERRLMENEAKMKESIRLESLLREGREARMAGLSPAALRLSQEIPTLN